jgi:large subunit ribosomal protein L23
MNASIFNFSKKRKETDEKKSEQKLIEKKEVDKDPDIFKIIGDADTHKILGGFYVSEKSSMGGAFNQYTFKVFKNANKSEIKKEIGKLFDVKVKKVQIINMPKKRRDIGKHPGFKPGFKKAVVVLEKGYEIKQTV